MTPDQYCQDKAAKSGSSFYYSFRFLPPHKRRAITALYAFCREVDDVVDECSDANVARTTLNWWRGQVAEIYGGKPQHPVALALIPVVKQFNLAQEHLLEIIDGMEMDIDQPRYPDFESLQLYCYRVASVVGLLSAEIFGYRDPRTLEYAHDLGIAFQLTNIIRDVGEDARRNRIYLPMEELQQFGVAAADILNARETEEFHKLMAFQIERARRYYRQALDHLPAADRKAQRTGLIMAAIYRATLDEVEKSGCHVLKERVSLTPAYKMWLAFKTWLKP
ncbi:MAG: squalene synthase HpnD [Gallionellales bacterium RIFCSPLOWO2_12_FULL_59_22]|nr:MAG: squalene synthase HpnD [Gallionellales bacterium RIFCSPLOWO2_02_FULL_59_110]OGT05614.1 MAG: squalene synthase HpnD [Gallionellales bacterium RIFCSPLOWO2_02_58_13]OGT14632.1 MAG: squalene synthase HpnD [Gallionellales bacterium RIFCSPLOWO2_12_FULL_59_22]